MLGEISCSVISVNSVAKSSAGRRGYERLDHGVDRTFFAEEILAFLARNESRADEFEVSPLDFARIGREFLREAGRRRQDRAVGDGAIYHLLLDLVADLSIYRGYRRGLQFYLHLVD